jgi:hypothetical protein
MPYRRICKNNNGLYKIEEFEEGIIFMGVRLKKGKWRVGCFENPNLIKRYVLYFETHEAAEAKLFELQSGDKRNVSGRIWKCLEKIYA